jgi:hypothetical protein
MRPLFEREMKMKTTPKTLTVLLASLAAYASLVPQFTYAGDGASSGGGGDGVTEMRIDEIRVDILKWLDQAGGTELKLGADLSYLTYRAAMTRLLANHAVVLGSVTTAEENATSDPELKVLVGGQPKTCRGFVSARDQRPHILCNVERFKATPESTQYQLIHHEYAGLAQVERNDGASSDYAISSQITEYLVPETVLRLAVKKPESTTERTGMHPQESFENIEVKAGVATVKQSSETGATSESKVSLGFHAQLRDFEGGVSGMQAEGTIGQAAGKVVGGGKLEFSENMDKAGEIGVGARLVSDTGVRYSQIAKLQAGPRVFDNHGYVEINGSAGALKDRKTGTYSFQPTIGIQTRHQLGKRVTIEGELEAGMLLGAYKDSKTRHYTAEQGQVTETSSPTLQTREVDGRITQVTELLKPGTTSAGVGTVKRGKVTTQIRLNKIWSINAEAGATRTKGSVKDVYLDGSNGKRREVKNNEYRAGAMLQATF